jgi:undecaprenyl-diphosphatase
VGRHPPAEAPLTTFRPIGRLDMSVWEVTQDIRSQVLTLVARVLNVLGAGVFTIPLRGAIAVWLGVTRRWRALAVWMATWITAELLLLAAKNYFHRGRPPDPLVATSGFSFPSGHAVAAAATTVALVLVLMPPGSRRRKWEWLAGGFSFLMALSRVYLNAHWLSDVYAGVLMGAGIALAWAAIITELRDLGKRRSGSAVVNRRDGRQLL